MLDYFGNPADACTVVLIVFSSPVYCGDIAVNEPFALYGSDPTDATKYLYGRAAGQAIALDGYANLIKVNDPAIADMYFLNEFCHLTRNDGTSVSRLAVK